MVFTKLSPSETRSIAASTSAILPREGLRAGRDGLIGHPGTLVFDQHPNVQNKWRYNKPGRPKRLKLEPLAVE